MGITDPPDHKTGRKPKLSIGSVLLVALAAAGVLAGGASSSTTGTQAFVENAKRHLVANGVDPSSIVVQQGARNYAGPNCPGAGWTCTNAAGSVIQVGTQNTTECPDATCLIPQEGEENVAKCIQKSTDVALAKQLCLIHQTGTSNDAIVVQVVEQTVGQVQGAVQEVGISQNATGSTNRLQIEQEIKQLAETTAPDITQDQDAYQVVGGTVLEDNVPTGPSGPATQDATDVGDNSSQIVQKQIQRAIGGTKQWQNYDDPMMAPFADAPADCHSDGDISTARPNACVNFEQEAEQGSNHQGQLAQSLDQEMTTTVEGAEQRQNQAKFTGGADARVHQEINPLEELGGLGGLSGLEAPGSSQNQASQSETLRMFAPSDADQVQHGGASCCGFGSQEGGIDNSEQINQQKDLLAEGGISTDQTATLVGTSRSPTGDCAINHAAQTNSDQENTSAAADPCFGLLVMTTCENATVGDETVVGACQPAVVEITGVD